MSLEGGTVVIDVQARFRNNMSPGIDNADKKVDAFTESIQKSQKELDRINRTHAKLDVNDTGTSKVEKFLRTTKQFAGKTFTSTVRIIDYATKPLQAIKNTLFSIKGLVATVGTGMVANKLIMQPIQVADTIENARIGFETLLGDAELANKKIEEIKAFAAKTPFDTMGVVSGVQQMLNSGWDVNNVMADMEIIGNAAAATGNSTEGFSRILTAINQMRMSGKVNAQDMMQLTNANLPGWLLMAEGLNMSVQELREATQKGTITAEQGIAGLLKGFEKYDGMMDQISKRTVSGIWSNIKDTFNIKVVERWGDGLKKGALDAFTKMADVLDVIDPHLKTLGDYLFNTGSYLSGKFSVAVDKSLGRLVDLLDSDEFKNASIGGKFKLAWDEIVAKPFSAWWDETGKAFVVEKAGEIGKGLGSGISSGVAALLGFDAVGTTGDGLEIGKAFTDGFIEGLDTEKIKQAFLDTFKEIATDALKVLPGGDNPTTSSWISAGILGYLGRKPLGKMLGKMGGSLFKGASSDDLAYIAWLAKNANPNGKGNFLGGLGSGFSSLMGKVGGSKVGGFFKNNWLSLLFAGGAIASADNKWYEAGRQGAGLAGSAGGGWLGAKAGAAIGSFIMPGVGTAVGAGVGGFAGSMAGYLGGDKLFGSINWDAIGDGLQRAADGLAEDAKKLATVPNEIATGFSEFWSGVSENFNTFIYDTVPGWWDGVCSSIDTWWETNIGGPFSEVCASFQSAIDGIAGWFGEKKESFNTWWEGSSIKKGWDWLTGEEKHATGGIFTRPHRGLVAEAGPEAIIPLSGIHRQRGLNLWRQAGVALGATAGGAGVNVGGVTVNITVDGAHATLVDALNSQSEEIKEAIAGVLYAALSESFQNQPILI